MIKCHPSINDSTFNLDIEIAIKEADLIGYISRESLKQLFNLFSWVYLEKDTKGAFEKNTKLESFLDRFDLFRFKGPSICYSAVLFYQKLSKTIDLRELENDEICTASVGSNKLFSSSSFMFKDLYKIYAENKGDLSEDFLLFNQLFKETEEKKTRQLSSYGEVTKAAQVSSLVRPDLSYKIATKQLEISYSEEKKEKKNRTLYILQDCTYSMEDYLETLKILKAFILNQAFMHDYIVEWLYVSTAIIGRTKYTQKNISEQEFSFIFGGSTVNMTKVLTLDELTDKKIIIITDGTDSFNFSFSTKSNEINVISFTDNIIIKNKISNYGRFFKVNL